MNVSCGGLQSVGPATAAAISDGRSVSFGALNSLREDTRSSCALPNASDRTARCESAPETCARQPEPESSRVRAVPSNLQSSRFRSCNASSACLRHVRKSGSAKAPGVSPSRRDARNSPPHPRLTRTQRSSGGGERTVTTLFCRENRNEEDLGPAPRMNGNRRFTGITL
jgi:hypothetical protein